MVLDIGDGFIRAVLEDFPITTFGIASFDASQVGFGIGPFIAIAPFTLVGLIDGFTLVSDTIPTFGDDILAIILTTILSHEAFTCIDLFPRVGVPILRPNISDQRVNMIAKDWQSG